MISARLVVLIGWVALMLSAASAQATPLRFEGDYIFSWSGIRIGKLQLKMQQANDEYHAYTRLKTAGLAALFDKHESLTTVQGSALADDFIPQDYVSDYGSEEEPKRIALSYDAKGAVIEEDIIPKRDANDTRPEVPQELKNGAKDSLTALFAMRDKIRLALAKGESHIMLPLFDGKRRYNLHASIVEPNHTLYLKEGEPTAAVKLALSREPVAGFKDKELKRIPDEPPLYFYVEKRYFTLLGLELSLYGGTLMAWVRNACINDGCEPKMAQANPAL